MLRSGLPREEGKRAAILKRLEQLSRKEKSSQIFMETPYRNNVMMKTAIRALAPKTLFHVSCNLTMPDAFICTKTMADWKKEPVDLHKKPTVFCLQAF